MSLGAAGAVTRARSARSPKVIGQFQVVKPRHVRACVNSPTSEERWVVWWWSKDNPDRQHRCAYKCRSWRCQGECARHDASVIFARYKQAIEAVEAEQPKGVPHGWVFLVLTLDRDGYYGGTPWADVNAAFRALNKLSRKVKDRIGRRWGSVIKATGKVRARHVRSIGNRWCETVEVHQSGWPHLNLVMWCPELAEHLRADHAERLEDPEIADAVALVRDARERGEQVTPQTRERARRAVLVGGELRRIVEASGWGCQSTAEVARDIIAVAAYGAKLAGMFDAAAGELAKVTQAPLNAPERTRRLRYGKGFFPKRYKNEAVTGCLFRRQRDVRGDWRIVGMNTPMKPEAWAPVQRAYLAERALIDAEEHALSQGVELEPMRRATIGEATVESAERRQAMLARRLATVGGWKVDRAVRRAWRSRAA